MAKTQDERTLSAACEAVVSLKLSRLHADSPRFTAHDTRIAELEEWCSLFASESEEEDELVKVLDRYRIENRPYA